MQKKLTKLFWVQLLVMLVVLLTAWLSGQEKLLTGIAAGSLIAIMTTIMAMLIFRRLPQVIPAKMFYGAMVLNGVMKWLLIALLSVLLLQYVAPVGLIIGFISTYLAYFWLILVD